MKKEYNTPEVEIYELNESIMDNEEVVSLQKDPWTQDPGTDLQELEGENNL